MDDHPRHPLLIVATRGTVIAFARDTGKEVWRRATAAACDAVVELYIRDRFVIAASPLAATITCLDYATGQVLGSFDTKVELGDCAVVADHGEIFVVRGGFLEAFDPARGHLWCVRLTGLGAAGTAALGFPGNFRASDDRGDE